jgi:type VI secretion system protein ImpL
VRALEDNIVRFTKLSERGSEMDRNELLANLADLSKYLFEAELPADVMNERGALSDGFNGDRKRQKLNMPLHMHEDFAAQIKRIARAVRSNLHYEVKRGEALLTALDHAEPPVLANTRRFAGWLMWTEKSWAMSTPLSNPCEQIRLAAKTPMDALVLQYGYDNSLMRELARFDTDSCYRPEMQALADLRQAPYGAFFRLRKPEGLTLAAGFKDEMAGMPALVQMGFMRLPSVRRFTCLPGSEGFRQAELTEAASYLREYEAFAAKMKLTTNNDGNRPLYDRLARMSLANALDDAMQRSQIAPHQSPYQQVSLEAVTQADQQLSAMSKELTGGLDKLIAVLNSRGDYGDGATVPVLRQCARDFASDSLSRVTALAESSRLYAPAPTNSGDAMYDLGGLPVVKEYLSRQVARAQVLANYATPFMNLLAGSKGVTDTRREASATAEFWRNSIDELNRYTQGKEPVGQVANLDNYFIRQLSELTYTNCGKQLAAYQSPEAGNDLFSTRRRPLESLVQQRCSNRRVAQAMEVYGALAQRFNHELAGRYPFADTGARDAASVAVRQFFLDYAQQRAALEDALASLGGDRWRAARQFVNDLDAVAEFFRSNLSAGDSDPGLPIRMRLAFNSQLRPSSGSEQIVAWMLSSGSRAAALPNGATTLDWQIGESLALDLSWASRSLWSPVADPQQSDLVVESNTASFIASKPWALMRMIERHVVTDTGSSSGVQQLLGFALPQQREVSPGKSERGRVSLYLGMTLLGVDPKTQVETRLRLPARFPRSAPMVN